jgi:phosphoribosylglycinamide formyltransferase 2
MTSIGTPLSATATRVLFCGGGELGKEVVIELQRLGVEVIVLDRYDHAPAMQVAHRSYTVSMLDGAALRAIIKQEQPHYIVPEIEAIATDTLVESRASDHEPRRYTAAGGRGTGVENLALPVRRHAG